MPPKAKTSSSDKVVCACGCGKVLSRRTQTRHLQACGPVMAVAEVIETRAYFGKRGAEGPESPQPQKRQRLRNSELDNRNLLPTPTPEASGYTPPQAVAPPNPLPSPTPAPSPPSKNLVVSQAAHEALSAPWTGPADFRYGDDKVFEDSNDTNGETALPVLIAGPTESEGSDTDSEGDDDGIGSSRTNVEDIPDIFEADADLNAEEYSM